jgi:hypothetical protein
MLRKRLDLISPFRDSIPPAPASKIVKENHRVRSEATTMMRKFLVWFFRNRETGEVTIVQAPNLALWVVIAAGALLWFWPKPGGQHSALEIVFKGGLIFWAIDEIVRGVNPWRRCLGAAVLAYELTTIL